MKKCLACENTIEEIDHYVCRDCYKKVKDLRGEYVTLSNFDIKTEYERWKRNMILARDQKYKNEYQLKMIALAELMKEKYNESKYINAIIDYSNNQKEKSKKNIEINEAALETEFERQNSDLEDINNYEKRYKCKDGHRTISKSERTIDDWLTENNIRHSYDTTIDSDTYFRCDFQLLDYKNVYIEHWGYKDKKNYLERKEIKSKYYKDKGYILIETDEDIIKDDTNLRRVIGDFLKKLR